MASPEKSLSKKSSKPKSKKSKKHRIRRITVEPTDNDGFVARHEYHPDDSEDESGPVNTPPDSTHAFGNADDLLAHLSDHLGGTPAPDQSQGTPAPTAGAVSAPQGGM